MKGAVWDKWTIKWNAERNDNYLGFDKYYLGGNSFNENGA